MQNDFTIGMRFEGVWFFQTLPQGAVVVDLAVDGQNESLVRVDDWLSARI